MLISVSSTSHIAYSPSRVNPSSKTFSSGFKGEIPEDEEEQHRGSTDH
jgi:hypothetical protein